MRVRHRLFAIGIELDEMVERGEIGDNIKDMILTASDLLKQCASTRRWVFPEEESYVDRVEGSDG